MSLPLLSRVHKRADYKQVINKGAVHFVSDFILLPLPGPTPSGFGVKLFDDKRDESPVSHL